MVDFIGGRDGTRTHDLQIKSPLLYQLSYAPPGAKRTPEIAAEHRETGTTGQPETGAGKRIFTRNETCPVQRGIAGALEAAKISASRSAEAGAIYIFPNVKYYDDHPRSFVAADYKFVIDLFAGNQPGNHPFASHRDNTLIAM